ncbi:MAG: integration host factor subunit beta [Deltaproteobacteria bacterium]|nr:integration host factor subunit beta [Deltaproteobacteria bacterium]
MNKLDLIQTLSTTNGISKTEATIIATKYFEEMASSLEKGDRVEIRGLCTFYVKNYEGYAGRNPKTGERVQVKPKKLPYFKCGKELKERVDQ